MIMGRITNRAIPLAAAMLVMLACGSWAMLWTPTGMERTPSPVEVEVLDATSAGTLLEIRVPGFSAEEIELAGEHYQLLTVPGAGRLTEEGRPAVPALAELVGVSACPGGAGWRSSSLKPSMRHTKDIRWCPSSVPLTVMPLRGGSSRSGAMRPCIGPMDGIPRSWCRSVRSAYGGMCVLRRLSARSPRPIR